MVVVLPLPFTPTTSTTCGRAACVRRRTAAPGARALCDLVGEHARAPPRAKLPARSGRLATISPMRAAMATPRSAWISTSSSSSSVSSSSLRLVNAREIVRKRRGALREPLAKLGEPAPLRLLRRGLIDLGALRRRLRSGGSSSAGDRAEDPSARARWTAAPLGGLGLRRGRRAASEQPLQEGRLLRFAHGATTARSDAPSSPVTTASTRAPAPSPHRA